MIGDQSSNLIGEILVEESDEGVVEREHFRGSEKTMEFETLGDRQGLHVSGRKVNQQQSFSFFDATQVLKKTYKGINGGLHSCDRSLLIGIGRDEGRTQESTSISRNSLVLGCVDDLVQSLRERDGVDWGVDMGQAESPKVTFESDEVLVLVFNVDQGVLNRRQFGHSNLDDFGASENCWEGVLANQRLGRIKKLCQ